MSVNVDQTSSGVPRNFDIIMVGSKGHGGIRGVSGAMGRHHDQLQHASEYAGSKVAPLLNSCVHKEVAGRLAVKPCRKLFWGGGAYDLIEGKRFWEKLRNQISTIALQCNVFKALEKSRKGISSASRFKRVGSTVSSQPPNSAILTWSAAKKSAMRRQRRFPKQFRDRDGSDVGSEAMVTIFWKEQKFRTAEKPARQRGVRVL